MKKFYKQSIGFWFILLILAFINAIIRETTYKPLLTPYIGLWAHQISTVTGILIFFWAIYIYLKQTKEEYVKKEAAFVGLLWVLMTIIFESLMNVFVRKLSLTEVLQTYYFWRGETWIFVLLSLIISPVIVSQMVSKKPK